MPWPSFCRSPARKNGSKTRDNSSADMPMPVSLITDRVAPDGDRDASLVGVIAGIAQQVAEQHREHPGRRVQFRPRLLLEPQLHGLAASSGRTFSISSRTTSSTGKSSSGKPVSPSRARIRKASIRASMSRPAPWMRLSERRGGRRQRRVVGHHVAGHPDHRQRRAQFMRRVAGEVVLALDEAADARGEVVQRGGQHQGLALDVHRQVLRVERARIGMFRIPAAAPGWPARSPATRPAWMPGRWSRRGCRRPPAPAPAAPCRTRRPASRPAPA